MVCNFECKNKKLNKKIFIMQINNKWISNFRYNFFSFKFQHVNCYDRDQQFYSSMVKPFICAQMLIKNTCVQRISTARLFVIVS